MLLPVKRIIIMGSSAGGPRILKEIFTGLPRLDASIVLVQHMPKFINQSLRQSIQRVTSMGVRIAENGDYLENGKIYIAPSERHLRLLNNQQIHLTDGEKVNFVCPSVDVAMQSVKNQNGLKCIGVVLTGMGRDGADGIIHIKSINGMTIAQNEETSSIFGMPKEAIATGCVDWILSPEAIRSKLIELVNVMPNDEKQ